MKRFYKVSSKLEPEVQRLLNQYMHALNCISQGDKPTEVKEFNIDPFITSRDF